MNHFIILILIIVMYRFGFKIFKAAIPTALAFYTIRPIFTNDQTSNIVTELQNIQKLQNKLPLNIQDVKTQQIQHQAEQKNNSSQSQSKQNKTQPQQGQAKAKIEQAQTVFESQTKNQSVMEKAQEQAIEQLNRIKKINPQNEAQISDKTPNFIKKYLQMKEVKVTINNNLPQNSISLKNKAGDSIQLNIQSSDFGNNHAIFKISNFINPIHIITSKPEISSILKNMANDQYLIVTYIPQESVYKDQLKPKSLFDTFTGAHQIDINVLQKEFRNKKYASGSSKNSFAIIRDPDIARSIKLNPNKIGNKYVFYKSTANQGMQVSTMLEGHKYTIKTIPAETPIKKDLTQTGIYSYINQIDFDQDMVNFLRSIELKRDDRKVLVIYSKQKRPQFLKQIKSVALKSAKIMKEDVLVVMTNNQKILRKYFQIIPDDFVTVRLIDTNRFQPSILSLPGFSNDHKKFYSRKNWSGVFTVQNLCKFVKRDSQWKQYYEFNKKVPMFESIVSQNQTIPNNSVVLHWKHGCKGCQLTLNLLQQIKVLTDNLDQNKQYQYEIQHPQILKNIKYIRFNILNEQTHKNQKDHDVTPKLILHTNGKKKSLQIGEIIGKIGAVNANNYDKIHQLIMKQIIQLITSNVQSNNDGLI